MSDQMQEYRVRDPSGRERVIRGPAGASDDAIIAQAQKLFLAHESVRTRAPIETPDFEREAKRTLENPPAAAVAWNSTMKGIAQLPDALINTPVHLENLRRAAVGTAATAAGRTDLAPELVKTPNMIRGGLTDSGMISPYAEPQGGAQKVMDAAIQAGVGGAMMPANSVRAGLTNMAYGTAAGGAGQATEQITGSPLAGAAVSMLTPLAIDQANVSAVRGLDRLRERGNLNAERDATTRAAREAGYVYPPSQMSNTGFLNNRLESIAGKAALNQEATRRNVEVTQRQAAQELGLPADTAINATVLRQYRQQVSGPFREIEQASPFMQGMFERLRNLRDDASRSWREYNGPNHPRAAYNEATALDQRATNLETMMEREAQRLGRPDLITQMREARQRLAKSYDIERALNEGDATVSAVKLGRALDRGAPLSGNLETVARAGLARHTRPSMGEGATTPGISALEPYAVGSGIAASLATGHPGPAIAGAGIPLMRGPVRSLLLSNMYQNRSMPNYDGSMLQRGLAGLAQPNAEQLQMYGLLGSGSFLQGQ